jgi:hypothetical protein
MHTNSVGAAVSLLLHPTPSRAATGRHRVQAQHRPSTQRPVIDSRACGLDAAASLAVLPLQFVVSPPLDINYLFASWPIVLPLPVAPARQHPA